MARSSLTMSRSSIDGTPSEVPSEASGSMLGTNANSIAYLVYANRGDPYAAGFKPPTTRDIPQIKLPRIDHSKGVDLGSYLKQIRRLEALQSREEHGQLAVPSGEALAREPEITPLSAVPAPFFSDDFQLDNPRVYSEVIGEEDSNMMQEKLSWYVDIVEAHLAREIARASSQFFAATSKFGAIEEHARQTSQGIEKFAEFADSQQRVVSHYLETAELQSKLRDAQALCSSFDTLQELKTSVEQLEAAVAAAGDAGTTAGGTEAVDSGPASTAVKPNGDGHGNTSDASGFETARAERVKAAMEPLSAFKSLLANAPFALERIVAARALLDRAHIVENRLRAHAGTLYVGAMMRGLRNLQLKIESQAAPRESVVFASAQQQEFAEQEVAAQRQAQTALEVAQQLGARATALEQYEAEVDREVKHIIRRNVPSSHGSSGAGSGDGFSGNAAAGSGGDLSEESNQALARSLHSLSPAEADQMCERLFKQLALLFLAIKEQDIPDVGARFLESVVKSADSRLARVLRVRKDPATTLVPDQFIRFFSKVTDFCDTCFAVTDTVTHAVELQDFLVAQTKLYIHNMHALSETRVTMALEADDWRKAEIGPETQHVVDLIAMLEAIDPDTWDLEGDTQSSDLGSGLGSRNGSGNGSGNGIANNGIRARASSPSVKGGSSDKGDAGENNGEASGPALKSRVELGSQTYLVSKSTTTLLASLVRYLRLASSLPSQHTASIAYELIDLLKLFNHKSHHLILGFGATRTAGLKHISVKNLVLCLESLRLIEALQAPIKKCFERHLPQESEEDSMLSTALSLGTGKTGAGPSAPERQLNPAVSILCAFDSLQQAYFDHRSEIHRKLVKLMNDKVVVYSKQIGVTDWSETAPQANKYMLDLVRQTTTVAHIAQEMMPTGMATKLVEEIYAAYKPKLLEAYANVRVDTVAEKRNVLRDLAYFRAKSELLRGSGNTGEVIYESVNGFVAPELSAEPNLVGSQRASLDLPRGSMEEGDATLAYEPEDQVNPLVQSRARSSSPARKSPDPVREARAESPAPAARLLAPNVDFRPIDEANTSSANGTETILENERQEGAAPIKSLSADKPTERADEPAASGSATSDREPLIESSVAEASERSPDALASSTVEGLSSSADLSGSADAEQTAGSEQKAGAEQKTDSKQKTDSERKAETEQKAPPESIHEERPENEHDRSHHTENESSPPSAQPRELDAGSGVDEQQKHAAVAEKAASENSESNEKDQGSKSSAPEKTEHASNSLVSETTQAESDPKGSTNSIGLGEENAQTLSAEPSSSADKAQQAMTAPVELDASPAMRSADEQETTSHETETLAPTAPSLPTEGSEEPAEPSLEPASANNAALKAAEAPAPAKKEASEPSVTKKSQKKRAGKKKSKKK